MNVQNNVRKIDVLDALLFDEMTNDLNNDCSLYILDELFPEKKSEILNAKTDEWSGFSDLLN